MYWGPQGQQMANSDFLTVNTKEISYHMIEIHNLFVSPPVTGLEEKVAQCIRYSKLTIKDRDKHSDLELSVSVIH